MRQLCQNNEAAESGAGQQGCLRYSPLGSRCRKAAWRKPASPRGHFQTLSDLTKIPVIGQIVCQSVLRSGSSFVILGSCGFRGVEALLDNCFANSSPLWDEGADPIKDVAQVFGHLGERSSVYSSQAALHFSRLQGLVAIGEDVQQGAICDEVKPWKVLLLLLEIIVPKSVSHRLMRKRVAAGGRCRHAARSARTYPGHR